MRQEIDRSNFFRWALSEINSNLKRGLLAEYLTAEALGIEKGVHEEWGSHDLEYKGKRVEVKSSGYGTPPFLKTKSPVVPKFDIRKRVGAWSNKTNTWEKYGEPERHNDVYVFAFTLAKSALEYKPFEKNSSNFVTAPTRKINSLYGDQSTVGIGSLFRNFGIVQFSNLKNEIDKPIEA